MPNTAYTIWRSADGVLIRAGNGEITLSAADALALSQELAPQPRAAGRRWTPEEDAKLQELYAQNLTIPEIARQIGRASQSTSNRATYLGIAGGRHPVTAAKMRARRAAKAA